jgi:threonine dehydratase
VIAGQGTAGLEIAHQAALHGVTSADVAVCCGGGGLTAGIALALAQTAPDMRVRPIEPAGFDDVTRSLQSGKIEHNAHLSGSICDAIITPAPGVLTFPIMKALCGAGVVVTDDECLRAMALAFLRLKIVLEPGGAAGLAAALFHPDQFHGDDVIAVATGGNVDPAQFHRALETL